MYLNKILVGMDVSGISGYSNYNYLGVVMGTQQDIIKMHDSVKGFSERMTRISNLDRQHVVSRIKFDSTNTSTLCVKLDRENIVKEIRGKKRNRKKQLEKGKVLRTYNRVVMQVVTKELNRFLVKHGSSTSDIVIQCDSDCVCFAKAAALKHERKGIAHTLSDYVAWFNGKNKNFKNVKEIDVTKEISDKTRKILK